MRLKLPLFLKNWPGKRQKVTQAFWSYFGNVKIVRVVSLFVFNNLMGHFLVHENYCWLLLAKIADLFTKNMLSLSLYLCSCISKATCEPGG